MSNKIWAEKYRPTHLYDYIFPTDGVLQADSAQWVKDGIFPNLILAGIQGTGKSSLGRILINEFGIDSQDTLIVDGSVSNKVDDIREKVVPFCDYSPMSAFKVVLIEEAHRLTMDAQSALLETVERNSDTVRFIFTTNYPNKLRSNLLSRCPGKYFFNQFNEDAVMDRIAFIIEEELGEAAVEDEQLPEKIEAHIEAHKPDIRAIVSSLQYSVTDGQLGFPTGSVKSSSLADWEELLSLSGPEVEKGDMLEMVYMVDNTNFELFYTSMYERGLHHFPDRGEAVVTISNYLARAMSSATQGIQSIHFEAMIHALYAAFEEEE